MNGLSAPTLSLPALPTLSIRPTTLLMRRPSDRVKEAAPHGEPAV